MAHGHNSATLKSANHQNLAIRQNLALPLYGTPQGATPVIYY